MSNIVLPDNPESAVPHTMTGWKSRSGRFYGPDDERIARWDGATHVQCSECGTPTDKSYLLCESCRAKKDDAAWVMMPRKEWDGKAMVYSETKEEYYGSPGDAEDTLEEGETLEDLRLVICEPEYAHELDSEYWADSLPGDEHEAPSWLDDAIAAFNKSIEGQEPLSWFPGKFALLEKEVS